MNEILAREEICRIGQSLFSRGYVHATAGNISVRLEDGFLITPTDACLGYLEPHSIAKVDRNGRQVSGDRASKTLALHSKIYSAAVSAAPNTRCVIHTHSTHCVALTLENQAGELLPAVTPYFVMKVGHVPASHTIALAIPQWPCSSPTTILRYEAAGTPIRAVMLSRLGPNVWHETPAQAMAVLEELEETACLWAITTIKPEPLSDAEIEQLRSTLSAIW